MVSLVRLFEVGPFEKSWVFKKCIIKKCIIKKCFFFLKAECLVKTVKKCFLKKLSVWLAFIEVAVWGINYQKG